MGIYAEANYEPRRISHINVRLSEADAKRLIRYLEPTIGYDPNDEAAAAELRDALKDELQEDF